MSSVTVITAGCIRDEVVPERERDDSPGANRRLKLVVHGTADEHFDEDGA